jgi:hypothetical protein
VALQCERPACAEPATVTYGFDAAGGVAWLEPLRDEGSSQGRLCRRHADAMVVPRGWWLDDRRDAQHLFERPAPVGTERPARTRRPWRPRRRSPDLGLASVPMENEAPDAEAAPAAPSPAADLAVVDGTGGVPWTPVFVVGDDLDGVLNATSPLLSRAFGRVKDSGTRARPPA